jgi:serine phosphatase RsbU (regulator of sigma subunit)
MLERTKSDWVRYGSAVVAVLVALLFCLLLDPLLEGHLYYVWFLLAVVLTGWYAGFLPCLLCLVLSLPVLDYFFAPPRYAFGIDGTANQLGFLSFCLIGLAVLLYTGRLGRVELLLARQRERQRAAREIQQAILPKAQPHITGFEIRARAEFAEDVVGDCFDYLPMSSDTEDSLAVVLCDAVGHGMAAALLVSQTRACLRGLAAAGFDIGQMLHFANDYLLRDMHSDYFVTAFVARLDPGTQSLRYINMGHCAGFILNREGKVKSVLNSLTQPLGVSETRELPLSESFVLKPGELVVLMTDGITEAASPDREQFGAQRVLEVVRVGCHEPLDSILDSLFRSIEEFTHRRTPQDDMTVVLIRAAASE